MKHTLALLVLLLAIPASAEAAPAKPPVKYYYCLNTRPAQCFYLPRVVGKRVNKVFGWPQEREVAP
jgi:hypothetical protein